MSDDKNALFAPSVRKDRMFSYHSDANAGLNHPQLPQKSMEKEVPELQFAHAWSLAWMFRQTALDCQFAPDDDDGHTTTARQEKLRQLKDAVAGLDNLARTRCTICDGWGHSRKVCPTESRLSNLMTSPVAKNLLATTRHAKTVGSAAHMMPDAPLPRCTVGYSSKHFRTGGGGRSTVVQLNNPDDLDDAGLEAEVQQIRDSIRQDLKLKLAAAAKKKARAKPKARGGVDPEDLQADGEQPDNTGNTEMIYVEDPNNKPGGEAGTMFDPLTVTNTAAGTPTQNDLLTQQLQGQRVFGQGQ